MQDLKKIGITLQTLFNPFNHMYGINYKTKEKSMSIVFNDKAGDTPKAYDSFVRIIRKFEKDNFDIPDDLSPYAVSSVI